MAKRGNKPSSRLSIKHFRGLLTNADAHDIPPGATQEQNNLQCISLGKAEVRKGMVGLEFANAISATSNDILAMHNFNSFAARYVCYLDSAGLLKAGRTPTLGGTSGNGGAPSIATGLSTFVRPTFAKSSDGVLYIFNGINTPQRWDGTTASTETSLAAPSDAFTVEESGVSGGLEDAVSYSCGFRHGDDNLPLPIVSALTNVQTFTSGTAKGCKWTAIDASSNTRARVVQLFRNTDGQTTTYYLITELGHNGTITSAANNGGTVRFTVPAGHKLCAGARITVTGAGHAGVQQVTAVTDITIDTDKTWASSAAGTWVLEGFDNDIVADSVLNTPQFGTISATANASGNVQITVNSGHGLTVGAIVTLTNHPVAGYNNRRALVRSVSTNDIVLDMTYTSAGSAPFGNWTRDNLALPILDEYDEPYARKQVPALDAKQVGVWFQDRLFLGVDVYYDDGTVTTNGTTTLTGSGTAWTSTMVGRFVYIVGETTGYRIVAVASGTSLTLERAASTSTAGLSYTIRPDPATEDDWYYSQPDEPESVPLTNVVRIQRRKDDDDRWTAAAAFRSDLLLFKERSTYRFSFIKQAKIDSTVAFLNSRGAANAHCAQFVEDVCYCLDENGPWSLGGSEDIGESIRDMWRDAQIDFSKKKWWFVQGNQSEGVVRFYVAFSGATRPKTAFCYSYRTQAWWKETYAWEIGGACLVQVGSQIRQLNGGEDDAVYLTGEGTLDGTTGTGSAVRGTLTTAAAASATTITLPTAAPSDCDNAPIAFCTGSGKRQYRKITGGQGTTSLTITPALTTAVPAGSVYQIGAIEWNVKFGQFEVLVGEEDEQRQLRLTYQPTSDTAGATTLDLRLYTNHETEPLSIEYEGTLGDYVTYTRGETDSVVNMNVDRDSRGDNPGHAVMPFDGRLHDKLQGIRFFTPEMRGYQGESRVKLYGLDIDGVVG